MALTENRTRKHNVHKRSILDGGRLLMQDCMMHLNGVQQYRYLTVRSIPQVLGQGFGTYFVSKENNVFSSKITVISTATFFTGFEPCGLYRDFYS